MSATQGDSPVKLLKGAYGPWLLPFLTVMIFFVTGNYLIWKNVTEAFLAGNSDGGDLSRLGYIPGSKMYRYNHDDLPLRHLEQENFRHDRPVDVLTLGDSFSNLGGGGKNRYYQDYIATVNRATVLNVRPFASLGLLEALVVLCNNGYLDRVKPRHLLFSSSEKLAVERFGAPMDFSKNIPMAELLTYRRSSYDYFQPKIGFVNLGNVNYLKYRLLYNFSPCAIWSNTYQAKLTRELFSVENSDILLFYRNDLKAISYSTDEKMKILNDNLNIISDILARKGITLHFMPCVDKYDLYSDYIAHNSFPRSTFFEKLRKLPKRYHFIDTKEILKPAVDRGEKDIFYPDDSHWSWKASEIVFSSYRF